MGHGRPQPVGLERRRAVQQLPVTALRTGRTAAWQTGLGGSPESSTARAAHQPERVLDASSEAPSAEEIRAAGFRKWDADFHVVLDRLRSVLSGAGETTLIGLLDRSFSASGDDEERLPERGAQALSVAFQLLNMVEENTANQMRRVRETAIGPEDEPGTCPHSLAWLTGNRFGEDEIRRALRRVHVQPVLTAHPTEAKRATVLDHHRELYLLLLQADNPRATPMERAATFDRFEAALDRLWRTGEIFLERPDVESEIRNVFHYLTNVFPEALHLAITRFDQSWRRFFPGSEPAPEPRLTFGSWVGGDRDGHPLVTTEVTAQALQWMRAGAVRLLRQQLEALAARLSLSRFLQRAPPELQQAISRARAVLGQRGDTAIARNPDEPWRQFLNLVVMRLPRPVPALRAHTAAPRSWMPICCFCNAPWKRLERSASPGLIYGRFSAYAASSVSISPRWTSARTAPFMTAPSLNSSRPPVSKEATTRSGRSTGA